MEVSRRRKLIQRYLEGYQVVVAALSGVSDSELDARPPDGGWTAREVVHHLADSETTSYIRIRRLLAQDEPNIEGYDENEFARKLAYDRPITASLEVFRAVRAATAELLDRLADEQWQRRGSHTESGEYSVEVWMEVYAAHAHDHANQIRRARASAQ